MISEELERYLQEHSSPQCEALRNLERKTYLETLFPRMISGHIQGKFLEMISFMIRPLRILEIGTFTGYGAVSMAKGLPENGLLITIEQNRELEDTIREVIDKAGLSAKVNLIIGNARHEIKRLDDIFDLVFIDADKENYSLYYDLVFDKVKQGGFILADNVLWSQKVIDPQFTDIETKAIRDFNQKIARDERVEQVLLPMRDGLMLIRKL